MAVEIDLTERTVLVVGGSSGIGRAAALSASAAGASVAVAGRNTEKLEEVLTAIGSGTALPTDLRDPASCRALVRDAAAALGDLDVVLFASGVAQITPVDRMDPATIADIFATNAIGPTLVAEPALDHLSADGVMLFLSSTSANADYPGLAAYAASKAALERLVRAFRVEHPNHRFVCVEVGDTTGTDIGRAYDPELAAEFLPSWLASGVMYQRQMDVADLGRALAELAAMLLAHPGIAMPKVSLVPPGSMRIGSVEDFLASVTRAPDS